MTRRVKPAPDPLAGLKVEVHAALGESAIKAECPLPVAADVLARLHAELERLGTLRPTVLPIAPDVPAGALYVPDDECGARKRQRVGFGAR
jgi:hypothetical protein